jgi:hypothetical protein
MDLLRQAAENSRSAGSDAEEPTDLESEEKKNTEEPRDSGSTAEEPTESGTKEPRSQPKRSKRRSQRRGKRRSSSPTGRHSKAFQFSPTEERNFKRLVLEVEELVHKEDPSVSVQNSHLVRAMVQMVADDIREGYTNIVDYVLDEIDKD